MEVAGFFFIALYLFIFISFIVFIASFFTSKIKKTLHNIYLAISIIVIGASLIIIGLLFSLGGSLSSSGLVNVLTPLSLIVVLLFKPIKKSVRINAENEKEI